MIWGLAILGLILLVIGLFMAAGQIPTIGGPGMAWLLLLIGLFLIILAWAWVPGEGPFQLVRMAIG